MPRKRMLHYQFFQSQQLAALSLAAAYTYEGFWCFADDRGRNLDDPESIWSDVWLKRRKEVDVEDVEQFLDELVEGEQLCRYVVGGDRFLHVIAWDEHQKISHPTPSKLPPCPDHHPAEWVIWWGEDDTATDRWRKAEKTARAAALESGDTPENGGRSSGDSPPQCSSVQARSDQLSSPEKSNLRHFPRKSQERRAQ